MKPRVVLDTQIWLDWLHFQDTRCAALERMHGEGRIELCIDPACREEAARVLAYPALALDAATRQALLGEIDARTRCNPIPPDPPPRALPRCRDPDDQKFVILAVATGARVLLSRDHALLALHRRLQRDFALSVVPAQRLAEALAPPSAILQENGRT